MSLTELQLLTPLDLRLAVTVTPNYSGEDYIAHCSEDAGSSTVSNTDGSITSQVRVSQTAGFAIASYTGNQTSGATIGIDRFHQTSILVA